MAGGEISLVEALLEELPEQFLSYMRNRDIKPATTTPLHLAQPYASTSMQNWVIILSFAP